VPDEIAIRVENVSKDFVLPHEQVNSIKSLFTSAAKKRGKGKRGKETQHALRNISFEIKKGEFFGIVGRNGSGKSTLLKILAGIYQPTSGQTYTQGKLVPFIELGVGFNPELTGRENIFLNGAMLGFSRKEVEAMYNSIVEFAELERFMDQKLKNYSSGMQVRLAFSMAIRAKAEILLVDEVLAVGDADFQRKCFDYFKGLKSTDTTVIFVTHDMNAVREYCDRAILIKDSYLVQEGPSNEVAASYTRMFIEEAEGPETNKAKQKRWGDKSVLYTEVQITPKKLTDADKELVLRLKATAQQDMEDPIYGFLIKNVAHEPILGTNSLVAGQPAHPLKKGESMEIEWRIPNIFNDGLHYVDPAITHQGNTQVADWWEEAASFRELRENSTPYLVNPDIELSLKAAENVTRVKHNEDPNEQ
jgi:ABC-2 type transport system ATP-binding protein